MANIIVGMEPLKPQDVLVVLKLCAINPFGELPISPAPSMAQLAADLGMSASEVHQAIRRAKASRLLREPVTIRGAGSAPAAAAPRGRPTASGQPNRAAIIEFLVHGLKYVFPPKRGEPTRGVPTSHAAPPMNELLPQGDELIPVWPWPEGTTRGVAFEPLYRSVPEAALRDPRLYELLALADALRDGRSREKKMAEEQLRARLLSKRDS